MLFLLSMTQRFNEAFVGLPFTLIHKAAFSHLYS